jgi:hypothetical protein
VTTIVTDAAPTDAIGMVAPDPVQADEQRGTPAEPGPALVQTEPEAAQPTPRRPSKFLADLARAMQSAAEQARTATLEQVHADGNAVIEEIHARSASAVEDLRRRADEDVSSIKDWSKAEIARIRDETEARVTSRREQLTGQLDRHAALIEHEIEQVRGRITSFEGEMGRFFDELLREEDPAQFAARAASLPEPPPFVTPDEDALRAILTEPGLGVPTPETIEPPVEAGVEPAAGTTDETGVDSADEASATAVDPGAAMAAIQAAAEAAEAADAASAEAASAEAPDAASAEAAEATSAAGEAAVETVEGPEATLTGEPEAAGSTTEPAASRDPRLAVLGLIADFATAEAAAAEAAAADADGIPEVGGDRLAARLADLVPDRPASEPVETASTQVITTGLVSVASIAGFKRHLGRLPGVVRVGVSSGPDGEFVFAVEHDPAAQLPDLIPTIPGFGARVVGSGDGVVQVHAQDPQD